MFKRLMLSAAIVALGASSIRATAQEGEKAEGKGQDTTAVEPARDARGDGYEVLGVVTRPYVQALAQRPSGPDSWSMALGAGVEVDWEPVWVALDYTLHDVIDEQEIYPFDGTFALKLGLYKASRQGSEVPMYPHAAFVLARPTGPDEWSPGFELGVKFILDPMYVGVDYTLRDLFLAKRDEVYGWNSEFAVGLGTHF